MKKYAWIPALMVLFGTCNTREPMEPDTKTLVYKEQDKVENVVNNLYHAIQELDKERYMACFGDTFEFVADPAESLIYGNKFVDWDRNKEEEFFSNYRDIVGGSKLEVEILLSPPRVGVPNLNDYNIEDSLYIHWFKIDIQPDSAYAGTMPLLIKGYAWLYFEKSIDNNYYIYKWSDERYGSYDTWSKVKGIVY